MKKPSIRQIPYANYDTGRPGGGAPSIIVSDITQRKGSFFCLLALVDTVIAAAVNGKDVGVPSSPMQSNGYGGLTIKAGVLLYGDFSTFTLTSGAVQAFTDDIETSGLAQPASPPFAPS